MKSEVHRRGLMKVSAASGVVLGVEGGITTSTWSAPASQLQSEANKRIERLADRIMETSPHQIVNFAVNELRQGLSRRQLLAACFNAGIRFHGHHSGYVAHPIQVVSDEIGSQSSLLPLFYYLSVLRFRAGRSRIRPIDSSRLPAADKAQDVFHQAMKRGEQDDAQRAMVSMAREFGPRQAFGNLWMYGAERNHNSGGHTAISVANTWRTLQATDWRCAEAALQFAVFDARRPPGGSDVHALNRRRADRVGELPPLWSAIKSDSGATLELLNEYRKGNPASACKLTFKMLGEGIVHGGSIWDAVFLTTAELVIRYTWVGAKMLAGHSVTCVNALHYMFRNLTDPVARLYAMLEAVEWTTSFLARERYRPALRERSITAMEPDERAGGAAPLDEIFGLLPPRRFASMSRVGFEDVDKAMELLLAWAQQTTDFHPFLEQARQLMCLKSTPEVHDFKFPMALFENCRHASPQWRPRLLAASVHVLQGTDMEDSQIVQQARDTL